MADLLRPNILLSQLCENVLAYVVAMRGHALLTCETFEVNVEGC